MRVGFLSLNTSDSVAPGLLGRALEDRGYESLWIGEHPHLPLLAAALATEGLLVATGITLLLELLERSLFAQAKQPATLDLLSGGRLICGVGAGWSEHEFRNSTALPWERRYEALGEYIRAMRIIWTSEEPAFAGEFFGFDRVWSYPKPRQPTGPPILVGGGGSRAMLLAAMVGDGWCPLMPPAGLIRSRIDTFRSACDRLGRDPDTIQVTFVAARDDPGVLDAAREAGAHRVVLGIEPTQWNYDSVMPYLDRCARYVSDLA